MKPLNVLAGERHELDLGAPGYPPEILEVPHPPEKLYVIGDLQALQPGLAVIGARKATPYGRGCARRFAKIAAEKGACIISGGARGCDAESHRAALDAGGVTVAFLGGGCDRLYPKEHFSLFQAIIDSGGAVVSEWAWDVEPRPFMFRERNRLIAGLAGAVLIVEAGLPSGTFSTADEALAMGKEVLVVPGAITSAPSHGSNRLLYQGAIPVVDDESFEDTLFTVFGMLRCEQKVEGVLAEKADPLLRSILAAPMDYDELLGMAKSLYGESALENMAETLAEGEVNGLIARQPDGRWGPAREGLVKKGQGA